LQITGNCCCNECRQQCSISQHRRLLLCSAPFADRSRPLLDTDIVNLDVTVFYNGYHGDTSATFLLPNTDAAGRELVACTEEALERAIAICKPGVRFSEIGRVIE